MISLFTGSVGSGKSYHALSMGLRKVNAIPERFVIANFPLRLEFCNKKEKERWQFWEVITPEKLIAFAAEKEFIGKEGYCLLIIDEAGVLFNSRDWMVQAKERTKWVKFFSQSRKFGYDVILISQDDRMIDRQIRSLAEYEVKHFDMRRYWFFSWIPLKMHMAVWRWYHTKIKGTADPFLIRKSVYKKYDTMRIFNIDELVAQIKQMYGKVIPAPVAKFIAVLELQKEKNKRSFSCDSCDEDCSLSIRA